MSFQVNIIYLKNVETLRRSGKVHLKWLWVLMVYNDPKAEIKIINI